MGKLGRGKREATRYPTPLAQGVGKVTGSLRVTNDQVTKHPFFLPFLFPFSFSFSLSLPSSPSPSPPSPSPPSPPSPSPSPPSPSHPSPSSFFLLSSHLSLSLPSLKPHQKGKGKAYPQKRKRGLPLRGNDWRKMKEARNGNKRETNKWKESKGKEMNGNRNLCSPWAAVVHGNPIISVHVSCFNSMLD